MNRKGDIIWDQMKKEYQLSVDALNHLVLCTTSDSALYRHYELTTHAHALLKLAIKAAEDDYWQEDEDDE